jgi:hypothetical protein
VKARQLDYANHLPCHSRPALLVKEKPACFGANQIPGQHADRTRPVLDPLDYARRKIVSSQLDRDSVSETDSLQIRQERPIP